MEEVRLERRRLLSCVPTGALALWGPSAGTGEAGADVRETAATTTAADASETAPWPGHRGRNDTVGSIRDEGPALETQLWSVSHEDGITAPAVVDGRAYLGVGERVVAVDPLTGVEEWATDVGSPPVLSPAVDLDSGAVVVTTEDSDVTVLEDDGEERWSIGVSGTPGPPTVADGRAFVGTTDKTMYALALEDGGLEWQGMLSDANVDLEAGLRKRVAPAVSDGVVYANVVVSGGSTVSDLVAFDAEDGDVEWRTSIDQRSISAPAVAENEIYVASGNEVIAVARASGSERWSVSIAANREQPPVAVLEDVLVTSGTRYDVYGHDRSSGEEEWTFSIESRTGTGGVALAADAAYVVDQYGDTLHVLDLESGLELDAVDLDDDGREFHTGPAVTPDAVYAPHGTTLTAFGPEIENEETDGTDADEDDGTNADETNDEDVTDSDGADGDDSNGAGESKTGSAETTASGSGDGWLERLRLETIEAIAIIISAIGTVCAAIAGVARFFAGTKK